MAKAWLTFATILTMAPSLPVYAQEDAAMPAGTGTRLERIATHTPDGRLNGDATMGQLAVSQYGSIWEALRTAKDREAVEVGLGRAACGSFTDVVRSTTKALVKAMPQEDRAAVERNDAAVVRLLAIRTVASLDGVSPDVIVADEAIGPGVYSDPIAGVVYAFGRCKIL